MANLLTLAAATVVDALGAFIPPIVRGIMVGSDSPDDAMDYGQVPLMNALGVTALPAPANDNGHAEGVFVSVPGYGSACIGARDTRCPDVVGQLKPGETALHNTGGDKANRARVFCKENYIGLIVGNNLMLMLDRKNSKFAITAFGHVFEISTSQGIVMMAKGGKNGIRLLDNGSVFIWGTSVNLGGMTMPGTPATKVIMGPSGMTGVPAPNVYITV